MNKLFVYGTLRQGQPTHRLPGYMMFKVRGEGFDFPFIQPYPYVDAMPNVLGSVVDVTDDELEKLDVYEGVARGLYIRQKAFVVPLGRSVSAMEEVQVYVGGPALAYEPIPSGVWPK